MSSEAVVQQQVRLAAAQEGIDLYRNNSGACRDDTGRLIRYGLGNDSAKLNGEIKSSDLIGITPTLITGEMVGYWLGVFTAIEVKPSGWTLRDGDERGQAQAKFHEIVTKACGYAGFATCVDDALRICRRGT